MSKTTGETWMSFPTQARAFDYMVRVNRCRRAANREFVVVVEGPEGEYLVIELRNAIAAELQYSWAI